jgi:hypothetical protein
MFIPPPKKPTISVGQKLKKVWSESAPARREPPRPAVPQKIQCYLCVVDFPTMDDLWFHEQSDPIHQELVRVAVGIMPKANTIAPRPVDPRLNTFDI